MRRLIMAGMALPFTALPLLAQTAPPVSAVAPSSSATSPSTTIPGVQAPMVTSPAKPLTAAPIPAAPSAAATPQTTTGGVAGANSFTEAQAQSRIEAAGYTNVTGLAKDKDGVWRGTATKNGAQAAIGLDYQGNVVTR